MNFSNYFRWDIIAMSVALAVVFAFEMAGVFGKHYVTITAIVRATIPIWLRAMILGWLAWHFMIDQPK